MASLTDWMGPIGAGVGVAGNVATLIGQKKREDRSNENQKKMMDLQMQNQMKLNKQGQALSMDMWNKTNYGAQMKHMKDAGLNVGMMYGGSGGGGTTANSGSGGSAASGSAAAPQQMDISGIGNSVMNAAQIGLINAQTKKVEAETPKVEQDTKLSKAQELNVMQDVENKKAQEVLTRLQSGGQELDNRFKGRGMDTQLYILERQGEKINKEIEGLVINNALDKESAQYKIGILKGEAAGVWIKNAAMEQGIKVDEAKVRQINASIGKMIADIQIGWAGLGIKERQAASAEVANKIKAEFPSVQQWIGKGANTLSEGIEAIMRGKISW